MKKLINKIKKIDKTKRIVIVFITISFVFIGGFSIYNGVTGNYQKDSIVVSTSKDKKEKNPKENKKNSQSNKNEINQVTDNEDESQNDNTTTQEAEKNNSSNEKSNSSNSTSQSHSKNSSINQSQSTTSQSQHSSSQTDRNQTSSSSTSNNNTTHQQDSKLNVSIQVIGMGNTMMSGTLNMDKGTTVYDALIKIANQNGISVEGTNIYIRGIGDLYEKQHGNLSGWMYSVNGVFPNKSCGYYKLENNDNIIWRYVNYK